MTSPRDILKLFHLVISDYPAKFCDHRPFGRGDIKLSVCHVTSHDHVVRGSCDIMGEFCSLSHNPVKFDGNRLCRIRDIKLVNCHVTLRDDVVKVSCDIVDEFP